MGGDTGVAASADAAPDGETGEAWVVGGAGFEVMDYSAESAGVGRFAVLAVVLGEEPVAKALGADGDGEDSAGDVLEANEGLAVAGGEGEGGIGDGQKGGGGGGATVAHPVPV